MLNQAAIALLCAWLHLSTGADVFTPIPGEENLPRNNRCINSYDLELGTPLDGTTRLAVFDISQQNVCGPKSDRPAVWYEIKGNGNRYRAQLCSKNSTSTAMGVFTACNNVGACHGFSTNTSSDCSTDSYITYEWDTTKNIDYFFHIRSEVAPRSDFVIQVDDISPSNNQCEMSTLLPLSTAIVGTTKNAVKDFSDDNICGSGSDQPGVWYRVNGNGNRFLAEVCSKNNMTTDYAVFSTSCSSVGTQQCVGGTNATASVPPSCVEGTYLNFEWETSRNTPYYLHIRSDPLARSDFEVVVSALTSQPPTLMVPSQAPSQASPPTSPTLSPTSAATTESSPRLFALLVMVLAPLACFFTFE